MNAFLAMIGRTWSGLWMSCRLIQRRLVDYRRALYLCPKRWMEDIAADHSASRWTLPLPAGLIEHLDFREDAVARRDEQPGVPPCR